MMLLALACLVLATTGGGGTSMRIERKASIRVRDGPTDILAIAADIELFAACIHSGLSTAHAATAVASVSENEQWRSVQALLAIGVGAGRAWEPMRGIEGLGNSPHWPPCLNVPGARYRRGANALWTNFVTTPRTRPPPQPNGQAYSLPCPSQCATYLHFSSWGWRQR